MFAVIEIGGHQYLVREGDRLNVDKMEEEAGKSVSLPKVLLFCDGKTTKIGTPYIAGATVNFLVEKSGLGDKVRTFKMKAKKRYKRLKGHREAFTEVKIESLKA